MNDVQGSRYGRIILSVLVAGVDAHINELLTGELPLRTAVSVLYVFDLFWHLGGQKAGRSVSRYRRQSDSGGRGAPTSLSLPSPSPAAHYGLNDIAVIRFVLAYILYVFHFLAISPW